MTDPPRIRTYLEMHSIDELKPGRQAPAPITLERITDAATALDVYQRVGRPYGWRQSQWNVDDMIDHMSDPDISIWFFKAEGRVIGFLKIVPGSDRSTQIGTFALLPEEVGKGFGAAALTQAIEKAWQTPKFDGEPVDRIWLRTLSTDHPNAMPNYLARGFKPYKTEPADLG